MGWLGKMLGGTIGFALGGPIGAVAGAAFGHSFDKKSAHISNVKSQHRLSNDEEKQMTFFIAAFSMLAKIAKADGNISKQEIDSIENFMTNDLQLNPSDKKSAVIIFKKALNSNESFEDFAIQFYIVFKLQPQIIELMMDILLRVSTADGLISPQEEVLLLMAAKTFNFSNADYTRLKSKYIKETNKFYAILDCDENSSNEKIKKQYRRLVSTYHPDKIASKGLPEEFIKFANDKFNEIQTAYENIKKQRSL
ncbi:MAG: molecular chaperone DjlA [Desulfobacteraceae bacterium 4572_130]|nr:MAG: molecular chaperone DjlA [Desulfobacteraceae bacterium 4572_130]